MKFRHFEFKLFPKLKNKKKKKSSKLCNPDYPRDIGLDKNFNYSKTSLQGFYDNLGADDNSLARQLITSQDATAFGHSRYRTYPLPELKIEVGSLCQCDKCTDACQSDPRSTWICVCAPEVGLTGSNDTPIGTPNTIPRTRTRIKTNPWLPSPRTTPSPSPTDPTESLLYASSEFLGSTKSCPVNLTRSRDESNPFHWTLNSAQSHAPLRSECSGFHSLVQIAELENDESNEDVGPSSASIATEVIRIRGKTRTQSIEQMTLDFIKETETLSGVNQSTDSARKQKRFSITEFLKYDTDGSNCASPVVETIELLSAVQCDIDFDYEERMDEMLETADFPRDATFVSIKELLEESFEKDKDVDETSECEIIGVVEVDAIATDKPRSENGDFIESISDLRARNGVSTDEAQCGVERGYLGTTEDMLEEEDACNLDNSNSLSNADLTGYEDRNMQESIDTGYASVTRDSDSMSSHEDVCTSSDLDLEWDNDPVTHHLTLDYRKMATGGGDNNIAPVQRARSRSLGDHGCMCNRKRSRSLADIETSLDEKVTRLREEKLYVQRKILEAIEEERIRHQQLRFFRSLSPVNRKEMLVHTLNDLKTRLEDQSTRLQASYDMVLSLQQRFAQRRKTLPALETIL